MKSAHVFFTPQSTFWIYQLENFMLKANFFLDLLWSVRYWNVEVMPYNIGKRISKFIVIVRSPTLRMKKRGRVRPFSGLVRVRVPKKSASLSTNISQMFIRVGRLGIKGFIPTNPQLVGARQDLQSGTRLRECMIGNHSAFRPANSP